MTEPIRLSLLASIKTRTAFFVGMWVGKIEIVLSRKLEITPDNLFPIVEERVMSFSCRCDTDPNQWWSDFNAVRSESHFIDIQASRYERRGKKIKVLAPFPVSVGCVIVRPLTPTSSWVQIAYEVFNQENIESQTQPIPIDSGIPYQFHQLAEYILEATSEAVQEGETTNQPPTPQPPAPTNAPETTKWSREQITFAFIVGGFIVGLLTCVAAWLVVPQVQEIVQLFMRGAIPSLTPTLSPTPTP